MIVEKSNIKLMEPSLAPWKPEQPRSRQIIVLMSGGVDSSVAAHLLKKQGREVLGITMKVPVSCDTNTRGCCGADAAFVCDKLGIAHYFVDVTEVFEELIIKPFRRGYAIGQTPNPCVDCNTILKFSLVWDFLEQTFGIDYFATGHYARISKSTSGTRLGIAKNTAKDQSYFLYGLPREKLDRFVLPLGELTKEQVRSIAAELGLFVAEKPESMELCFAGEGDYRQVLSGAECEGEMTDMQGNRIGTHKGISNYTLGQRKGLGFAGGKPLYVGKIDADTNTIALGTREEISFGTITANKINVLIPEQFTAGERLSGKIRSYGPPEKCKLIEASSESMTVEFDEPQFAPCSGQKIVLYNADDNIVAGASML